MFAQLSFPGLLKESEVDDLEIGEFQCDCARSRPKFREFSMQLQASFPKRVLKEKKKVTLEKVPEGD